MTRPALSVGPAFAARTHPRISGVRQQLEVVVLAVLLGLVLAAGLVYADRTSWSGSQTGTAVVTGRDDTGVTATAFGHEVTLHLAKIPAPGTRIVVEQRPDGRARPLSYRQTRAGALATGLGLTVGLALLVQVYRYFVTRRVSSTGGTVPGGGSPDDPGSDATPVR